ncbi:MAG: Na+/H+ antiporter subunit E [Acidimicrobiales bacterium]
MIARTVTLLVLWVALQGELTVGNVVGGLAVIGAMWLLFPPARRTTHRVHPVAVVAFVARLLFDLVVSSITVARAVARPTPSRTAATVVSVPLETGSRLVSSIVANAITLTPGTMTVDVHTEGGRQVLDVHVLGEFEHDEFVESIAALERRVTRAITPIDRQAAARSTREVAS